MAQRRDWLKGDIESLLLYILADSSAYGYHVIKELERRSQGYFKFKEGTLYPVLHRLERAGLIQGRWQTLPSGRRRKYYRLTAPPVVERRIRYRQQQGVAKLSG